MFGPCGQRVEGTTKGGRSRTLSLDRGTVAVLREHRRQQAEERLGCRIGMERRWRPGLPDPVG
jgi:hypothetical protein